MSRQAAIRKLNQALTVMPPQTTAHYNCPVTVVSVGAAADGADAVTVTLLGVDVTMPYLASWSPRTVGHTVRVQVTNGAPIILGRVVGTVVY